MESLQKLGKINYICGICYIVAAVIIAVVSFGAGLALNDRDVEGIEMLGIMLISFFVVIHIIGLVVAGIYCVITGSTYKESADIGKRPEKLLGVSGVLKVIFGVFPFLVEISGFMILPAAALEILLAFVLVYTGMLDLQEKEKEKKE